MANIGHSASPRLSEEAFAAQQRPGCAPVVHLCRIRWTGLRLIGAKRLVGAPKTPPARRTRVIRAKNTIRNYDGS